MEPLKKKIERFKSVELIPYGELLDTDEWDRKRDRILLRDNKKCYSCGLRPADDVVPEAIRALVRRGIVFDEAGLSQIPKGYHCKSHVHHKYYILNKLPWEYEDSLVIMCSECHHNFHTEQTVPVYYEIEGQLVQKQYTPCIRCNGAGWFPEYEHVQNGVCFRCGGWGWEELMIIKNRNIPNGI